MKFINWIGVQIDWLKGFFQEPDGKPSNKRLMGSLVITVFLVSFAKHTVITGKFEDIPMGWVLLIAAILGLNTVHAYFTGKLKNGNGHTNGDSKPVA